MAWTQGSIELQSRSYEQVQAQTWPRMPSTTRTRSGARVRSSIDDADDPVSRLEVGFEDQVPARRAAADGPHRAAGVTTARTRGCRARRRTRPRNQQSGIASRWEPFRATSAAE